MTKKEMFTAIRERVADDAEMTAFIDHEIELLSNRNPSAKAEADARAERVFAALAEMTEPVTLTELAKLTSDEEVAQYSNQRLSAMMTKLGDRVQKEKVKGKQYFSIA